MKTGRQALNSTYIDGIKTGMAGIQINAVCNQTYRLLLGS